MPEEGCDFSTVYIKKGENTERNNGNDDWKILCGVPSGYSSQNG